MNSIQPDHLHTLHLLQSFLQNGQEKSTSTPGSTNGKNHGLRRTETSFQNRSDSIVLIVYFKCQILISLSTTTHST